jgi:hypothetical protein
MGHGKNEMRGENEKQQNPATPPLNNNFIEKNTVRNHLK